jgi:hypothetical protein
VVVVFGKNAAKGGGAAKFNCNDLVKSFVDVERTVDTRRVRAMFDTAQIKVHKLITVAAAHPGARAGCAAVAWRLGRPGLLVAAPRIGGVHA